jgi:hypothetical protein
LILAAEAAFSAGNVEEAERLRQRLLQGNPHHMLKPFSSFAQALQSSNVQIYVQDLRENYPPETAETMLREARGTTDTIPPLPQTAPVIDMRDDTTLPLDVTVEPLKVYPIREESEETLRPVPPLKPTHVNRPAPRKPTPPPAAPPKRPSTINPPMPRRQPAAGPAVPARSSPPAVAPVASLPPSLPDSTGPTGAWLTLLLFGMTVTAGLALALYTLARPFVPASWLP